MSPPNSLLLITGSASPEVPISMGGAVVSATQSCIAVGTLNELDGETTIVVTDEPLEHEGLVEVFIGSLDSAAGFVRIASVLGETYLQEPVNAKHVTLRIMVNDRMEPDTIVVQLLSRKAGQLQIPVREAIPWLPPVPYFVAGAQRPRLRDALREAGFEVFEADVAACSTEREFLLSVGDALAFPDYYGANWAAFDDCLGDLLRADAGAVALLLVGVDNLMRSDAHIFVRCVHFLLDAVTEVERAAATFQFEVFFIGEFAAHAR